MNAEHLSSLIQFLYTGVPSGTEELLDSDVVFQDPLVVVKGRDSVLSMFRKLNRMFPKAHVKYLERQQVFTTESRWVLHVSYGGKNIRSRNRFSTFHTELIIHTSTNGKVNEITEHWDRPFRIRGDGKYPLSNTWRRFLGRLVGI